MEGVDPGPSALGTREKDNLRTHLRKTAVPGPVICYTIPIGSREGDKRVERESTKSILGLVGSMRRLGNCELAIKEISAYIPESHTLRLIRMPSLDVRPCTACYSCVTGKPCPVKDDMEFLLDRIAEADAVIIATPVYYLGAHSIFKRVLDRGFLFYRVLKETFGTPCILVHLYAIDQRVGTSQQTLMSFASFLGLTIKADVSFKAALPGEVILRDEFRSAAGNLAALLFSGKTFSPSRACPYCGCSIVRMREKDFLCTLCHGTFTLDGDGKAVRATDGGIFGSPEHMLLHKAWLASMKDRFMEQRKEILKTTLRYKGIGEWIEPEKT